MSCNNKPVETPREATSLADSQTHVLGTIFASAARAAATYTSPEFKNFEHPGVRLFLTATIAGGGTLDVKIQVKDPVTGTWIDLPGAAATQLTATGAATLTVYPGAEVSAGVKADTHLGLSWRVLATVGTATTTFAVGAEYLC